MSRAWREEIAEAVRQVRVGPVGPNALAILQAGGTTHLTGTEADEIADAVLAKVTELLGSEETREAVARGIYDAHGFHAADTWETDTSIMRGHYEASADAALGVPRGLHGRPQGRGVTPKPLTAQP